MLGSGEDVFQAKSLHKGHLTVIVEVGAHQPLKLQARFQLQGLAERKTLVRREALAEGKEIIEMHTQCQGQPVQGSPPGYGDDEGEALH